MLSMITKIPAIEPVSMAQVREDIRLAEDEDLLLSTLITSARLVVEAQTGCRLITQTWDLILNAWPKNASSLSLPHYPVKSINGIFLLGNSRQQIDEALYESELGIRSPTIFLKNGRSWPAPKRNKLGVLVSLEAGFGDTPEDVPAPLRLAIRQLASFWYEQGDWHAMRHSNQVPESVKTLMQPYRDIRL